MERELGNDRDTNILPNGFSLRRQPQYRQDCFFSSYHVVDNHHSSAFTDGVGIGQTLLFLSLLPDVTKCARMVSQQK